MATEVPDRDAIFWGAIAIGSAQERAAHIARACGADAGLREQVDQLVEAHFRAGNFLEEPAVAAATGAYPPGGAGGGEGPGTRVGPYKLLQEIGEGGMGVVWLAQQAEPVRRLVALKLIKAGMDSAQVVARFEAERQALALMDHPHIAKVFDGGTTESGRPFFVMELVKGTPITKYCDEKRLTPRERLGLFVPVCQAIQHAHTKGIIHRDVKPSNVLVAPYDGVAVPKVIDFGIAKATGQGLTERTLFTGLGAVVGTPEYMSPEQAELNNADVDTRSDVYSLGVLLYELLTGTTPLDRRRLKQSAFTEVLRLIREQEPPRPSTRLSDSKDTLPSIAARRQTEPRKLAKLVRGELDWIVMKALEKDRTRRYETANGLARDVQRYLADEPVEAGPPSAGYKLRKFARKYRRGLATAAALVLVLLLAAGAWLWSARKEAERGRQRVARLGAVTADLDRAADEQRKGRWAEARLAVGRAEARLVGDDPEELRRRLEQVRADLDFIAEGEEVRLGMAAVIKDGRFQTASGDPAFRKAFRAYGLDVEALDPEEAARRIRASAIKGHLVAALQEWATLRWHAHIAGSGRLEALARRASPDPWRDSFREALRRKDHKALAAMVRGRHVRSLSPSAVVLLAVGLRAAGEIALAVELLRQAQVRHPDDFWVNVHLAGYLMASRPARMAQAVRFYQAALALRPHNPGILNNLGLALEATGRPGEAEAAFREALGRKPGFAEVHVNLGALYYRRRRLKEAAAQCRQAVRLRPKWPVAHLNLGQVLSSQGSPVAAEAEMRLAVRLRPSYANAHGGLGEVLHKQGRLDEALAAFRVALRLDRTDPWLHRVLAHALEDKGRREEAVAAYREALRLDPTDAKAHNGLGVTLLRQGKLDEALAEFREAIRLDPGSAWAHVNLGSALRERGRWEEALAANREAVRLQPDLAEAHMNVGIVLCEHKRDGEGALAAFRKAVRLQPAHAEAHNSLGLMLSRLGRWAEAEAACREAIRLQPGNASAHNNLGHALEIQGKWDEALAASREALRLQPGLAESRYRIGLILCDHKGQYGAAAAALRELLRRRPNHLNAHIALGNVLTYQGKPAEAAQEYRTAIRLRPDNAPAHCGLGLALSRLGQWAEADAAYREALRLQPGYALTHFHGFGDLLLHRGMLDRAAAVYREVVRLRPGLALAHFRLGGALSGLGKLPEAEACYRAAICLGIRGADVHGLLGQALYKQGKLPEAAGAFHQAVTLSPCNPGYHDWLGYILQQQGKQEEAVAAFRQALVLDANHFDANRNLAWSLFQQKKYAEACPHYRKAAALRPADADVRELAVRCFALAGCGEGRDAARLGDEGRARLRRQAVDWLRADLVALSRRVRDGRPPDREAVGKQLRQWAGDPSLGGLRDPAALARLPAEEREACRKLWAQVEELLATTRPPRSR